MEEPNRAGVDAEAVIRLFEQLPQPFLADRTVARMNKLAKFSKYLKLMQFLFACVCVASACLSIRWLVQEATTRRSQISRVFISSVQQKRVEKQLQESRQTAQRMRKVLAKLENERGRAQGELHRAERDLVAKEQLLKELRSGQAFFLCRRRVNFLYASPLVYFPQRAGPMLIDALGVGEEYKLLKEALRRGFAGDREIAPELRADLATRKRLLELLISNLPGLCIHLACHGETGELHLENNVGQLVRLRTDDLSKLLRGHHAKCTAVEVVVLLVCSSEKVAQSLIDAGVQHVICTTGRLRESISRMFASAFWEAMATPETNVEEAFHKALVLLRAQGDEGACDAGLLVLLPDMGGAVMRSTSVPSMPSRASFASLDSSGECADVCRACAGVAVRASSGQATRGFLWAAVGALAGAAKLRRTSKSCLCAWRIRHRQDSFREIPGEIRAHAGSPFSGWCSL